jgi:predicted dehydrogenase
VQKGVLFLEKIKLGIIGLGMAWEKLHEPALARLSDRFEVAAVCDIVAERAAAAASKYNLPPEKIYANYKKMLAVPDIHAFVTLLPIAENYDVARAVISRGRHLVAEKPLASTPEAARELVRLKNRRDVQVMVAENIRYDEENKIIKHLIDAGEIGNVVYFIDNNITEYKEDAAKGGFASKQWRQNPDYAGGIYLDSGVHHAARWRYLFGDVERVFAVGRPSGLSFAPFSCINAVLRFADSIAGHYAFFVAGKETQAPLTGLRIFGTHGEIYLEDRGCGYVNISYKDGRAARAIPYTTGNGYFHEWEDFFEALRHGKRIESSPEKAAGDVESVFAILTSARLMEPVSPGQAQKLHEAYVMPRALREKQFTV